MTGIGLREASRKYGVPDSTLSHWVRAGLIRKIQERQKRGQPLLLYEADVKQLAAKYKPGRSRWNRPELEPVA
jgi:predicted site-specific integrase-resolvase